MTRHLTDVSVEFIHGTEKAILVWDGTTYTDSHKTAKASVWIPRSWCEIDGEETPGKVITLTMYEAKALGKGLI